MHKSGLRMSSRVLQYGELCDEEVRGGVSAEIFSENFRSAVEKADVSGVDEVIEAEELESLPPTSPSGSHKKERKKN